MNGEEGICTWKEEWRPREEERPRRSALQFLISVKWSCRTERLTTQTTPVRPELLPSRKYEEPLTVAICACK